MRLLLDTHSFLWFIDGDARLGPAARAAIEDESNEVLLRTASLWEMAIKVSLGKLGLDRPFDELIPEQIESLGIAILSIELSHLSRVVTLPFHHRDPFDRRVWPKSIRMSLLAISPKVHPGESRGPASNTPLPPKIRSYGVSEG